MTSGYHNDQAAREEIAGALGKLLADSYTLTVKTHGFHWNVEGPRFYELHKLFEELYTDLQEAVDTVAERIRALGAPAPGSFAAFKERAAIADAAGVPAAEEMIRQLLDDNRTLARTARAAVETAEEHDDTATADLATERVTVHEKAAWMLASLLR